ncbi:MAG: M13 family metallopeptidase [Tidjanibacter sp.]|nr:M13 family metallopeptidase [Tidjanibacter sp.]
MKKNLILAASIVMMSCAGNQDVKVPAIDRANFDETAAINQDFYQYANGGWMASHPMKPEYSRYGAFEMLGEQNEVRLNDIFSTLAEQQNEQGSVAQKIADLYKLGLDSARLNSEGAAPLMAGIGEIRQATDKKEISRLAGKMHGGMGSPFFSLYVDADLMNSTTNILYLNQGGLGIGDRDYYLDEENEAIRQAYMIYVEKVFRLAGFTEQQAQQAVKSVMGIENAIAKASRSNVALRDTRANYNMFTTKEVKERYKNIDWDAFAEGAGFALPAQINIGQPEVIEAVDALIAKSSMEQLKDYLTFNLIDNRTSYLSDDFYNAAFDFYSKALSGVQEQKPRWKRALAVTNGTLSEAVGEIYVEKYFPAENKEKMLELVSNLQKALGQHIDALEWMSDATKAKAREKLATFYVKIGYPDKWKDYSSLEIDPSLSYAENMERASSWRAAEQLAEIGKPVDREKWHMSPQTVNAYYNPTTNEICFPAAILQPPFFNPDADDAVNYGAIGVVIGHEMTHGFDDQGRNFDKDGNMTDWWTAEDAEAFNALAAILVDQFNQIDVMEGLKADGALTLGENIADQGGLRVAYTAMKNAQNGLEPEPIDGLTADQRFYLGYAAVWAQNIRPEEVARRTKMDVHSVGELRVNATLRNIDTFHKAFGITDGAMYLPEEERVIIW